MSVTKDLTTVYHQQDTDYYCGAACAQMVLDSIGAGLLDQDDLYADNHSHSTTESGWYTAPDGLTWTLNARRPASFLPNYFVLFEQTTEDSISRKIVWTIHHYGVAPVAMVYGSDHWIVVRGYTVSKAPVGSSDTSYSISDFYINNPWPPTPSASLPWPLSILPPPPHSVGDGCGTGGNRGIANEHITYSDWKNTYMTGVPSGHWKNKFIAVCDPEPAAERPGIFEQDELPLQNRIITAGEAVEGALAGLRRHNLYKNKVWKRNLEGVEPGDPLLVQHLGKQDSFYYIVPLRRGRTSVPVAARVDGRSGAYLGAISLPEEASEGMNALLTLNRRRIVDGLLKRRTQLPEPFGRFTIRREALVAFPTLVWRPCRESLSPYYPFLMYGYGENRFHIRLDGQLFTELHISQWGI